MQNSGKGGGGGGGAGNKVHYGPCVSSEWPVPKNCPTVQFDIRPTQSNAPPSKYNTIDYFR